MDDADLHSINHLLGQFAKRFDFISIRGVIIGSENQAHVVQYSHKPDGPEWDAWVDALQDIAGYWSTTSDDSDSEEAADPEEGDDDAVDDQAD